MVERAETLGLKVLFEGPSPTVDIVAVHGLGASPDWAWIRKVKNGSDEVHVNWLADGNMLPSKLPMSRIMTFNYESKWLLGAPKQRRSLCAIQLLTALDNQRKEEKETTHRPLLFIGHSFGGVVIEQSMISANASCSGFQYLALSTVGITFLGTPHRGTPAAKWGDIVAKTTKALGLESDDSILADLEKTQILSGIFFMNLLYGPTGLLLNSFVSLNSIGQTMERDLVVDEISACIDGYRKVPLPTDHLKINKYGGTDDPSYVVVYPFIKEFALNAVRIVQGRLNRKARTIVEDNSKIPNENLSCLQSLFLTDPQDDLASIRSARGDRVEGTCEWVLAQDQYTAWLVEDIPQLLWLSGGPGIGKTMISSFLVEELTRLSERSPKMILAYYFCDDKYQDRRTATAILRGLLLQLLRRRPVLFKHVQTTFDMSRDSLFTNFHALWRVFVSMIQDPEAAETCCLVDALDECEEVSRQLFLTDLVKLFRTQQIDKTFVKFIITSRRQKDIEESLFRISPRIRNLQIDSGRVNHDLEKVINVKVDELSVIKGYKPPLKEKIRSALIQKAGGTFLYVSLVVHDLKKTKLASQVAQKLKELPADLNKVYDKILSSIDSDCMDLAVFVIRWVTVARRPLTVDELAMICALDSKGREDNTLPREDRLDEFRDVYRCCEPLVYVDSHSNIINLVHQSAKDYLLGSYLQEIVELSQYHVALDKTNLLTLRTCLAYLRLDEFAPYMIIERGSSSRLSQGNRNEKLRDNYFSDYAHYEWLDHALAADTALATDNEFWECTLNNMPDVRDFLLIQAARSGQAIIVDRLLREGAEPNSRDGSDATALFSAARNGHGAIVRRLLGLQEVAINFQDKSGHTPLSIACQEGHEEVVKLFLSRRDVAINYGKRFSMTPLSWSVCEGREGVVKLLLSRKDVRADIPDSMGQTPLSCAVEFGYEEIVKLFLGREDVAVNFRNSLGRTPLSLATEKGHEAIVKLFLSREDVVTDTRDFNGQSPLSRAVELGHEAIVKLFLSREDVVTDTRDRKGQSPLSRAVEWGHEAIVKLFLNREDVVADIQDMNGQSPLSIAAELGHEGIARLLIGRVDVDIDSLDIDKRTPMSLAAGSGHEAVVSLLLSREDVAVDAVDKKGRTPLDWAIKNGHEAVARLLEEKMKAKELEEQEQQRKRKRSDTPP